MHDSKGERRQYPRWVAEGRRTGRINSTDPVLLINLSPDGAQIEHANRIWPGTNATLTLLMRGLAVNLQCRVVWSIADQLEGRGDAEHDLTYRTGLQFLDVMQPSRQLLEEYVESPMEQESNPT